MPMTKECITEILARYESIRPQIIDLGRLMTSSDKQFEVYRKQILDAFGSVRREIANKFGVLEDKENSHENNRRDTVGYRRFIEEA